MSLASFLCSARQLFRPVNIPLEPDYQPLVGFPCPPRSELVHPPQLLTCWVGSDAFTDICEIFGKYSCDIGSSSESTVLKLFAGVTSMVETEINI